MAFLGISMHLFQKQILPACQECCSCCLCKVCSSLEQKKGYERAITGSKIILTCPFALVIGKNKKKLNIFPLKRAKFDIFEKVTD